MIWCVVQRGASWWRSEEPDGGGGGRVAGELVDQDGCCGHHGVEDGPVFCVPYLYRHPPCCYSGSVSMAVVLDCCQFET